MRVRLVLGVALAFAAGALILEMSGRGPRIAATDHTNPIGFVATVQANGSLCQPGMLLPADVGSVEVLIGTYGRRTPALSATFNDAGSHTVAKGSLVSGAHEGYIRIPLRYGGKAPIGGTLCVHVGRAAHPVSFAGDQFARGATSEQIDGSPQPGRIDVVYLRPGRESWWQLLGVLDERFGVGKARFLGDWTLPVAVLLLLGVWVATVRLLVRELT